MPLRTGMRQRASSPNIYPQSLSFPPEFRPSIPEGDDDDSDVDADTDGMRVCACVVVGVWVWVCVSTLEFFNRKKN